MDETEEIIHIRQRPCGRVIKRTEMNEKQLKYSIRWCRGEITKMQKLPNNLEA